MKKAICAAIALTTIGVAVRAKKKPKIRTGLYRLGLRDQIIHVTIDSKNNHTVTIKDKDGRNHYYLSPVTT